MKTSFLGISGGGSPSGNAPEENVNLEQLKTLIDFFPIGKKLSYCPEFKKEIVFDTLVIAYCVNGNFVYSGEAIERDSNGYPKLFHTGGNEERIPVSRLKLFQLLVPDTTELEMKLDYQRRALIGRGRQFIKGNSITLISKAGAKGMSTVDTEVVKQIVLKDGPYTNAKMILLSPELGSLLVTDQRKKARTKISVPVRVSLPAGKLSDYYIIADMSDNSVRLRGSLNATLPAMKPGDEVILDIDLGKVERHYTLKGVVFRRSSETCVIELEGLINEGKLDRFSQLDLLELKAGLLNYSE